MTEHPARARFTVDRELIARAAAALAPYGLETPLLESPQLAEICGRRVWLKCENRQRTGSFKVRGAMARLAQLAGEARLKGVVASSAGNHGLGVAWAARQLGVSALVVVPRTVARVKLAALQEMMVKVRVAGDDYDEAERFARQLAEEADATFISPFDDPWVIAGNGGTIAVELARQLPAPVDAVVAPVGGGGLAAGLAIGPGEAKVIGVNSAASPAMARSLAEGCVHETYDAAPTLAEGLEGGVSATSVALCARHLHAVEVVAEESVAEAMRLMAQRHKTVIEGSAAVAVAALLEGKPIPGDGPICVVLSGRNVDPQRLRAVLAG